MVMPGGKMSLQRYRDLSPNCGDDDDDGNGHDDDGIGHGDVDEDDDDGGDYVCVWVFLGSFKVSSIVIEEAHAKFEKAEAKHSEVDWRIMHTIRL